MTPAPHLPPKWCDIKWHGRVQALPGLLLLVGIAVLSGVAAALMVAAWVAPPLVVDQGVAFFGSARVAERIALDPAAVNNLRQRMIALFDITKKDVGQVYPESAFVSFGALLSSDGWVVIPDVVYRPGREKQWEGVDAQGVVHLVERAAPDPVARVVYLKLSGDGFRVVSFPDWNDIRAGAAFWQFDVASGSGRKSGWRPALIEESVRVGTDATFPLVRPAYRYRIEPSAPHGALIATSRGDIVGFADENGRLIPAWFIARQLSSVLGRKPLLYTDFPVEGYLAEGIASGESVKFFSGVYVTKTIPGSDLQRGDLIIRIAGEGVHPAHLSRQILFSGDPVPFTVLRDGEEKEISVRKVK